MTGRPLSERFVSTKFRQCVLCLVISGASPAMAAEVAGFGGLGFFSETDNYSLAYGISADGSTVVGGAVVGDFLWSYRWSGGVMTAIPKSSEADVPQSEASAVSGDGSVVVGFEYNLATNALTGYRWSAADGLVTLPYETGAVFDNLGTADAISADGSVIGGMAPNAYRFENGVINSLPFFPGGEGGMSHVHGISADGSIIVGASSVGVNDFAFVWTESDNTTRLLNVPGASGSEAMAISADGSTIVGTFAVGASSTETAFSWTALGVVTMSSLSMVDGTISQAVSVTADGLWAVGVSDDLAALWDTRSGEVWDLNVLAAGQSAFDGWTLQEATGISADGLKIVGNGLNANGDSEGWMLTLSQVPEPSSGVLLALGVVVMFRRRRY